MSNELSLQKVFEKIQVVRDFPKPGIVFRHMGPLLADNKLFKYAISELAKKTNQRSYDMVCGLDARGFIIATAFQYHAEVPQVMIRKPSKLPGEKFVFQYKKEYGTDSLELEKDAIKPCQRVLIVDDLMATAGTLIAAGNLVREAGGVIAGFATLIEFTDLGGRKRLEEAFPDSKIESLFAIDSTSDSTEYKGIPGGNEKDNVITKFRPVKYPLPATGPQVSTLLMWHPTMESLAQNMLICSHMRPSYINWIYFADGWPNITFEPSETLMNKDLVFLFNMSVKELFAEQLALLVALPRQLINSLTIVVPYLGPATHDRVDFSGQLATAEPILKMLSSCVSVTRTGPPIVRIFDIHALQERFYSTDQVTMKLMSAVPILVDYLKTRARSDGRYAVVFPDDGSYKRFKYFFEDFSQIICSKIRDGTERRIIIREKLNWPDETVKIENVIIIDDLVQSGETLLQCAKALKSQGFKFTCAYATHAVFPNNSWKKFIDAEVIDEFFVTNTNPTVTDVLKDHGVFTVLDISEHLCNQLNLVSCVEIKSSGRKLLNVYVATTNNAKLTAVYEACLRRRFSSTTYQIYEVHSVSGISSGVPEQPFGLNQTIQGAKNRLKQCKEIVLKQKGSISETEDIFIAIENGIHKARDGPTYKDGDAYYDVPVVVVESPHFDLDYNYKGRFLDTHSGWSWLKIPEEYNDLIEKSLIYQNVTFGSLLEKKLGLSDWHKVVSGKPRKDYIVEQFSHTSDRVLCDRVLCEDSRAGQ
jgi:adenine phosphoribosyltransferase